MRRLAKLLHNNDKKMKRNQAIIAISLSLFLGIYMIAPDYDTIALEKASDKLSYEELRTVLKYYDYFEDYLSPKSNVVDTFGICFYYIFVLSTFYQTKLFFFSKQDKEETE